MQEQLSSPLSQVLKTYDFGNVENCELNIDISLIYLCLHPLMYNMCRNLHRRAFLACRNMYLWYILPTVLPLMKEDFLFKGRLIDNVMGFSTIPAAGDRTLTHHLYVSSVSSQMETVSKMCHFKLGQYHFALLNSP